MCLNRQLEKCQKSSKMAKIGTLSLVSRKISRTFSGKQYLSRSRLWIRYPDLQNISFALYYSHLFSLFYISLLFYILENFVKMIAVLLILDKCNLYISQNTKFVKTKDMKIQYDKTPIERYNFRSLFGETSCFSIWN